MNFDVSPKVDFAVGAHMETLFYRSNLCLISIHVNTVRKVTGGEI